MTVNRDSGFRVFVILAAAVLVIAGLKVSAGFFIPILLSLFIATISFPITDWLRRHRFPGWLAVFLTVVVIFVFLSGISTIAISRLGDLDQKWNLEYYPLLQDKLDETSSFIANIMTKLGYKDAEETVNTYFKNLWKEQLDQLEINNLISFGGGFLGKVASFLSTTFIVIVLTVFMLAEARQFGRRFTAIFEARGPNFHSMFEAAKDVQKFLGIKALVSLLTGVLAFALCYFCGVDFPVLWGILAFSFNFIPVIGSIVAGIPPVLLAIVAIDLPRGIIVATGYILINAIIGNFIEPSLLGRRFGLSTLVVVLSVLFWGWLWGPVGMLLAVPLMMILKVAVDHSYEFQWMAVAITSEKKKKKELNQEDELPESSETESA